MRHYLFFFFLVAAAHGEEIALSKKHILLTGHPGIGKSTIIQHVIGALDGPVKGVFAREEVIAGQRVGFILHTLDGQSAHLAHRELASEQRIGAYGVNIEAIESLVIPAILPVEGAVIVIDEIGLMQCCAPHFLEAVTHALDKSHCVIGTISLQNIPELLAIKHRDDVQIVEVTLDNRDFLPQLLLKHITASYSEGRLLF